MKVIRYLNFIILMLIASGAIVSIASGTISSTKDGITLNILTRHSSEIWSTYKTEFLASSYASDAGVTNIIFYAYPESSWITYAQTGTMDLGWGGGPTLFDNLVDNNLVDPFTDVDVLGEIAQIDDDIAGAPMKRFNEFDKILWTGAAISSFGFTINKYVLDSKGLPYPETWTQLFHPQYFSEVAPLIAMGNAPDTTSNTRIYEIIIQKFGWELGWGILTAMAANSRMYHGSTEVLSAVTSGEVGIGMTIDFYGFGAQLSNPDTAYILPEGQSIVNADPICLIKGADAGKRAAANSFAEFVLSQEGQSLWLENNINRLPVRSDAFDTPRGELRTDLESSYNRTVNNVGIKFNDTESLSYHGSLLYYFQSTLTDAHDELTSAWKEITDAWKNSGTSSIPRIQHYNLTNWVAALGDPFIDIEEAKLLSEDLEAGGTLRTTKMAQWTALAKDRYSNFETLVESAAEPEDTTDPVISNVVVTDFDSTNATIEWDTSELTTSTIRYGLTSSLSNEYSDEDDIFELKELPVDEHKVTLEGLVSGGEYFFEVEAKDLSENTIVDDNSGSYYSFELIDTAAPVITNIGSSPQNDSVIISWETDEFSTSQVNYGLTTSLGNTVTDSTEVLEHEILISDLDLFTEYFFEVNSSDGEFYTIDDNDGTKYSFTTLEISDEAGPIISNVEVNVTDTTAVITFTTDEPSRVDIYYGIGSPTTKVTVSNLKTSHTITITGLTLDEEYSYYISLTDTYNNTGRYPSGSGYETFSTILETTSSQTNNTRDAIPGFSFSILIILLSLVSVFSRRKRK